MKNLIKTIVLFLIIINFQKIHAQVSANGTVSPNSTNQNSFLEASGFEGYSVNKGKGLNFPRTDLTSFTFITDLIDSGDILNAFDGLVVYNSKTGITSTSVNGNNGVVTSVTPGFYYFSNPNGAVNGNVTSGIWTPLGSNAVKDYTATEIATSLAINSKQVYAIKGEFTTLGTNALITISKPLGMTGYYKMITYQNGMTFRTSISSFDMNTSVTTNNVVTGSGLFSEVYPAGTYSYTLEYFK